MKNEHPILFSAPMVKAILAGQKTQTRRVVKLRKGDTVGNISSGGKVEEWIICDKDGDEVPLEFACPYGQVGDRLWVRETFAYIWPEPHPEGWTVDEKTLEERPLEAKECDIQYRADTDEPLPGHWPIEDKGDPSCPKWKPSIFMPRWASRITLEITGVKVERVQDISKADAIAEGCTNFDFSPLVSYRMLWDSINGKRGYRWDKNPYVWVVSFKIKGEEK